MLSALYISMVFWSNVLYILWMIPFDAWSIEIRVFFHKLMTIIITCQCLCLRFLKSHPLCLPLSLHQTGVMMLSPHGTTLPHCFSFKEQIKELSDKLIIYLSFQIPPIEIGIMGIHIFPHILIKDFTSKIRNLTPNYE
jgi:hypothetical protein